MDKIYDKYKNFIVKDPDDLIKEAKAIKQTVSSYESVQTLLTLCITGYLIFTILTDLMPYDKIGLLLGNSNEMMAEIFTSGFPKMLEKYPNLATFFKWIFVGILGIGLPLTILVMAATVEDEEKGDDNRPVTWWDTHVPLTSVTIAGFMFWLFIIAFTVSLGSLIAIKLKEHKKKAGLLAFILIGVWILFVLILTDWNDWGTYLGVINALANEADKSNNKIDNIEYTSTTTGTILVSYLIILIAIYILIFTAQVLKNSPEIFKEKSLSSLYLGNQTIIIFSAVLITMVTLTFDKYRANAYADITLRLKTAGLVSKNVKETNDIVEKKKYYETAMKKYFGDDVFTTEPRIFKTFLNNPTGDGLNNPTGDGLNATLESAIDDQANYVENDNSTEDPKAKKYDVVNVKAAIKQDALAYLTAYGDDQSGVLCHNTEYHNGSKTCAITDSALNLSEKGIKETYKSDNLSVAQRRKLIDYNTELKEPMEKQKTILSSKGNTFTAANIFAQELRHMFGMLYDGAEYMKGGNKKYQPINWSEVDPIQVPIESSWMNIKLTTVARNQEILKLLNVYKNSKKYKAEDEYNAFKEWHAEYIDNSFIKIENIPSDNKNVPKLIAKQEEFTKKVEAELSYEDGDDKIAHITSLHILYNEHKEQIDSIMEGIDDLKDMIQVGTDIPEKIRKNFHIFQTLIYEDIDYMVDYLKTRSLRDTDLNMIENNKFGDTYLSKYVMLYMIKEIVGIDRKYRKAGDIADLGYLSEKDILPVFLHQARIKEIDNKKAVYNYKKVLDKAVNDILKNDSGTKCNVDYAKYNIQSKQFINAVVFRDIIKSKTPNYLFAQACQIEKMHKSYARIKTFAEYENHTNTVGSNFVEGVAVMLIVTFAVIFGTELAREFYTKMYLRNKSLM
jgi:hypothetical protein